MVWTPTASAFHFHSETYIFTRNEWKMPNVVQPDVSASSFKALVAAGLAEALFGPGPFTPIDEAFDKFVVSKNSSGSQDTHRFSPVVFSFLIYILS